MKNEKQHRLLFIIPAVIIAIILIICIAVAVSSKSGEKGKKKDSRSVSVTENTQVIVAESEALELVKKEALKESNIVDKDDKHNNGTQPAANDNSAPADSNSDNANTASDKSSEDKAAAGKKSSTGSDNAQQPAGNDSKPAASNQTATPEPAQSEPAQPEAPKNEYVEPGWIFYGSKAGYGMSEEQKAYMDSVIQQWINGGLSDDEIGDMFIEKIAQEWKLPMITAGVTDNLLCLFPSRAEVPDYSLNLASVNGAYTFIGLYTKGEYDENGYLKCYYWEAGVL
ncbi:hypothetical protein [Agathobacter sp.]|uniref:hypothetical protein n=1 Tax=Agathobacter sp. TaxID=2021311 RepID=UPI003FD8527E